MAFQLTLSRKLLAVQRNTVTAISAIPIVCRRAGPKVLICGAMVSGGETSWVGDVVVYLLEESLVAHSSC